MTGETKLMPDVIVDSVYCGELDSKLDGPKIDITPCVEAMYKNYRKMSADYELDNVITSVWVKRGDFVEQSVLKRIIHAIEEE